MQSTSEGASRQRSTVRAGAPWRRRGEEGDPVPWAELDDSLAGIQEHRGRAWTDHDAWTMAQISAQTWGPREVGDRATRVPEWWGDRFGRNAKELWLLAVVWAAFVDRVGGVRLTREQWIEVLLCSTSSVDNYLRRLEARGLIVRVQTWRAAPEGDGSLVDTIIVRPGPVLLEAGAPTLRGKGQTRKAALAKLRALRREARRRRMEISGNAWAAREARRHRHEARRGPVEVVPKRKRKARPSSTAERSAAARRGWARRSAELGTNHLQLGRPDVPSSSSTSCSSSSSDVRTSAVGPTADVQESKASTPIAEPASLAPELPRANVDPVDRPVARARGGAPRARMAPPGGRSAVDRTRARLDPLVADLADGASYRHEGPEHNPDHDLDRRPPHGLHSPPDPKICEPPRSYPGGSRSPVPPSGARHGLAPLRPGEAVPLGPVPATSPPAPATPNGGPRLPGFDLDLAGPEGRPGGRSSTAGDDSPVEAARRIRQRAEAAKDASFAELLARTRADIEAGRLGSPAERRPDVQTSERLEPVDVRTSGRPE